MSTALAMVPVPNASPMWSGRDATLLTPVCLPIVWGSQLQGEWNSIARDSGRGDAGTGRFGSSESSAIYLPAISGMAPGNRALVAQYLSRQALSPVNGQIVNYYA
jgi:hypothetical protein